MNNEGVYTSTQYRNETQAWLRFVFGQIRTEEGLIVVGLPETPELQAALDARHKSFTEPVPDEAIQASSLLEKHAVVFDSMIRINSHVQFACIAMT